MEENLVFKSIMKINSEEIIMGLIKDKLKNQRSREETSHENILKANS
jgi:hypothetical protein